MPRRWTPPGWRPRPPGWQPAGASHRSSVGGARRCRRQAANHRQPSFLPPAAAAEAAPSLALLLVRAVRCCVRPWRRPRVWPSRRRGGTRRLWQRSTPLRRRNRRTAGAACGRYSRGRAARRARRRRCSRVPGTAPAGGRQAVMGEGGDRERVTAEQMGLPRPGGWRDAWGKCMCGVQRPVSLADRPAAGSVGQQERAYLQAVKRVQDNERSNLSHRAAQRIHRQPADLWPSAGRRRCSPRQTGGLIARAGMRHAALCCS